MGLFDALSDLAYEVKMDRIISRADRELAKWDKKIAKECAAAKAENDAKKEVLWRETDKILQDSAMNGENEVPFHPEGELTEEMQEQVSAFVENMLECVDDFIRKIKDYESEEELYICHELDCPEPDEYGSYEFEYSTKAKAKIACKKAIQSLMDTVKEDYEEEKEHIVSYAKDYYLELENMFDDFISSFLESYDDYMSLECEDEAEEYISAQKSVFFNEKTLRKEMKQYNLENKFTALVNERFDVPMKEIFDAKQYFSLCTYDEDEESYCYVIDDACDKVYQRVDDFLTAEIDAFPDEVFKAYAVTIISYCKLLKNCLKEL